MGKTIKIEELTDTLALAECTDGFWLYDKTRGMNLSMRAKTSQAALLEALEYYQDRMTRLENEHDTLQKKVNSFLEQFSEDDED